MKVTAITLRPGNVIEYNGKLCVVTKYEIIQPGKGNSVIQVEVRDIRGGSKDNIRYRTQETVERLRLEQDDYQYLYAGDDDLHTFMHLGSYEQIEISGELIGEPKKFLQEGMTVSIETYEGEPLGVQLPAQVTMTIVEADPVVKGQTASSSYKPAILENGVRVLVPPHIESGTRIIVRTEDSSYVERAKD
ncbi:MAG: elongation factor P [Alphaproteobacteria bacterium CG_4_9_14_3_um_filter_47_13]|nr:MAG: elongation factor P [Alphaproteobacteria bacterium CG_4_9_14_3_um_filter_47_13]